MRRGWAHCDAIFPVPFVERFRSCGNPRRRDKQKRVPPSNSGGVNTGRKSPAPPPQPQIDWNVGGVQGQRSLSLFQKASFTTEWSLPVSRTPDATAREPRQGRESSYRPSLLRTPRLDALLMKRGPSSPSSAPSTRPGG